ncbi:MAG: helix-turn-helix domain-containing protein [Candidatus Nanopelagicaceae bacterium]|nr:helix-turn-helix domain-containing protein [Candidatus Nanopelagicaceae bacterium]
MRDPIEYLGPRLKEIRLKTGLSLREVARQLNVSPSFVSQIENGKSQPSVATLYAFARLLKVPVDVLFESQWNGQVTSDAKLEAEQVSRNNFETPSDAWDESRARISAVNPSNRSLITMDSGVQWERLAATSEKSVNFMEIIYEPGAQSNGSGELIVHDGYEYGYALQGEIEATIGDLVLTLPKGHSIGFDSSIPHKFRNLSTVPFRGIWFVHGCAGSKK